MEMFTCNWNTRIGGNNNKAEKQRNDGWKLSKFGEIQEIPDSKTLISI